MGVPPGTHKRRVSWLQLSCLNWHCQSVAAGCAWSGHKVNSEGAERMFWPHKVSARHLPTSLHHGICGCDGVCLLEGNKMDSPMHTGTVSVLWMYVLASLCVHYLLLLLSQSLCLPFAHVPCTMAFAVAMAPACRKTSKSLSLCIGSVLCLIFKTIVP